jgi:hypothetical protein
LTVGSLAFSASFAGSAMTRLPSSAIFFLGIPVILIVLAWIFVDFRRIPLRVLNIGLA